MGKVSKRNYLSSPSLKEFLFVKKLRECHPDQCFYQSDMAKILNIQASELARIIQPYRDGKCFNSTPTQLKSGRLVTMFKLTKKGKKYVEYRYNEGIFKFSDRFEYSDWIGVSKT